MDCYERWPDMRKSQLPGGRSINLVLTARGLRALGIKGLEGLKQDLINMSVPVLGRQMHSVEVCVSFATRHLGVCLAQTHAVLSRFLVFATSSASLPFFAPQHGMAHTHLHTCTRADAIAPALTLPLC